jgi:glycosyltransferase involved in cell wall biosynthesis
MKYYIVIPAHNEAQFIALTLQSLLSQTVLPAKIVVIDDNSTDETASLIGDFASKHSIVTLVKNISDATHLPGSKVIRAFQKGLENLNNDYDFIVKADADLIFPPNYFETVMSMFQNNENVGMAGGFAYIEKNGNWILENLTDKDHIRGAFKAYRKKCFLDIGGLRPAMGWDTADELLAKFYGWQVITNQDLKVKHLKPTGANYNKTARYKQGEAFYTLGYGFWITAIASAKLSFMKQKPTLFFDYVKGFWLAKKSKKQLLVTDAQAKFIRSYRLKKMIDKILKSS